MRRYHLRSLVIGMTGVLAVGACTPDSRELLAPEGLRMSATADTRLDFTGNLIIIGKGGRLPADLDAQVSAAGGVVVDRIPALGVAFATSSSPDFAIAAARIQGVDDVARDISMQWTDPAVARGGEITAEELGAAEASAAIASFNPNADAFYALQWAPRAIQAPEAWAAGYTGAGVRVAILDGGIRHTHVDLAANLDAAASRSFTTGAYNTDVGTFWHGTHVAGIVAAKANGIGTIGIAPDATIIGVKVLHGGSGPLQAILNGIVYAATPQAEGGAGAHVINMSLGLVLPYRDLWDNKDFRDFFRAWTALYDRATRYANQQGVTVVAAAGNDATNYDVHRGLYGLPAQSQHVISVSATGPHGWALGNTNFSRPAYYTDYGKSLVDFAAPGGTLGLFLVDGVDAICTMSGPLVTTTQFCETFDLILSTSRGSGASNTTYSWAQGTSMAAPAAAGVAALIIQRNGGSMTPGQVVARLRQSSLDLGKPGKDEFYGHGWVNAYRAVGGQ